MIEEDVLAWIIKQKEEDTIEEVTDEILENMIKEYEYVLVFFGMSKLLAFSFFLKLLKFFLCKEWKLFVGTHTIYYTVEIILKLLSILM